jgi:hypothetical protein
MGTITARNFIVIGKALICFDDLVSVREYGAGEKPLLGFRLRGFEWELEIEGTLQQFLDALRKASEMTPLRFPSGPQ